MPKAANASPKSKRFALNIVGAIEDRPRQIRAYGRACGGEFALVMRPRERSALLVHLTKQGGHAWRSGQIPPAAEGHLRARARLELGGDRPRLVLSEGPHAGTAFLSYDPVPETLPNGAVLLVEFNPNDQFAHLIATVSGDSPLLPFEPIAPKDAVAAVRQAQKDVPDPGPTTLRGRWSGHLYCDDNKPILRLARRLAAYGTLEIRSELGLGWSWSFHRDGKWFASEGTDTGAGYAFLEEAIEAGILGAMKLVREACSFRDTRRRAAIDSAYAQQHPIAVPKEPKNPVERLKEPAPPKAKAPRAPKVPAPVQDGTPLPAPPATLAELHQVAETATREADALAKLAALPWVQQELVDPEQIAEWFEESGFRDAGTAVRAWLDEPARPVADLLAEVQQVVVGSAPAGEDQEEALAQLARLRGSLESTPVLLERARKLVRYATVMVRSPRCQDPEQTEAAADAMRAAQVYESSREALARGETSDARRRIRMTAERVALSAAKVARACARGQQSLTARIPPEPPGGDLVVVPLLGRPATVDDILARTTGHVAAFRENPSAANAKRWVKSALGAFGIEPIAVSAKTQKFPDSGGVRSGERVFVTVDLPDDLEHDAQADQALALVTQAARAKKGPGFSIDHLRYGPISAAAPKRGRKAAPAEPTAPTAAPEVDPAKDKALLDAFSAAIAQAMGGGAA